ncbi:zinc ribbon domain-containing protein [Candidatus Bathyarchaeota archaeon]|nr:zinc ribbon domain-containing protein [Candidatus Bathyarchaeota archaeon]
MKCPFCQAELTTYSSFCPFCGNRLDAPTVYAPPARSSGGHAGLAIGLIALLVLGGLFASGALTPLVTRIYDDTRTALSGVFCLYAPLCPGSGYTTTPGKASYDQQISVIFAQDFTSLSYNVTAVPQQDTDGFGPAYLLNGKSDTGYWYQVGIAYNWPLASGTSYVSGFHFIWEVFLPNGTTTNPTLSQIPDNVNANDTVNLNLYFAGNNVVMLARDLNTRASSSHSYTAGGGSKFVGTTAFTTSSTPTSLMTEWYHPNPSWTTMKPVLYSEIGPGINSARVCIAEWVPPNPNSAVYSSCSSQMVLTGSAQSYSYHGLNTFTDQNTFQTGPSP